MTSLSDYFDTARSTPWIWGSADCCFFAGDWIRDATGRDPLEPYRGRYATAGEAGRFIMRAGGLHRLLDPEMVRCGFRPAGAPQSGDIAVVRLPEGAEHGTARSSVMIADGPWWVGRTLDGIAGIRAEPPVIWRVLGDLA